MKAIEWDDKMSHIAKLSHKDMVQFALFCAKQVIHLIDIPEVHECIRVVELWLEGKASAEDCERAANAAADAAWHAAGAARAVAYAAYAAYAAYYVAYHAARAGASKQEMMEYLYELVYINEIAEQVLLKGQQ